MKLKRPLPWLAALTPIAATLSLFVSSQAATDTWSGAASGTWDTVTPNWLDDTTDVLFNSGNDALFTGNPTNNVTAATGLTIGAITLDNTFTGSVTMSGSNTVSGATTISGGTLIVNNATGLGTSAITVNNGGALNLTNLTYANAVSGAGTVNVSGTTGDTFLTGKWSGFTGTLNLSGGGTIFKTRFTTSQANLISSSATINVNSGTTIYLNQGLNYGASVHLFGAGNSENLGALRLEAGANQTGSVTLHANSFIGVNASAATLSGNIGETGGSFGFTKQGNNTLTLSGLNSYSGATAISSGTLQISAANHLGDGSATNTISFGGGTLRSTANTYDLGSNRVIGMTGNGTIQSDAGTLTVSGGISATSAGNKILTVQGVGNTTIIGTIAAGSGGMNLNKRDTGTLTLSGGAALATGSISNGGASLSAVLLGGTTKISTGTYSSAGEFVVGGVLTNGGAGVNTNFTMDGGDLSISSWLSVGRGNGIGAVSSDIVLNNAATVTAANLSAGYSANNALNTPKGTITLNGTSGLSVSNTVNIAESAGSNVTVNINDTATFRQTANASQTTVGGNDGAVGIVNVNGGTATFQRDFILGGGGTGSGKLVINSGTFNVGEGSERWLKLNNSASASTGQVDVNGGNLNLNANTDIRFSTNGGATGTNVINLNAGAITGYTGNNNGVLSGGSQLDMNQSSTQAGVNNTFNLNGGTLTIGQVMSNRNEGNAAFNFNGGTLKAAAASTAFLDLGGANQRANVRNGGAIIDSNGVNVTIVEALQHSNIGGDNAIDGGLTKNGAGTTTLNGANTYTGKTTVTEGSLALGASGSIANSSEVALNGGDFNVSASPGFSLGSSQKLTGNGGSVTGDITVNGTLAIGSSPGTITFNDNLAIGSSAVSNFEFTSTALGLGTYDLAQSGVGSQSVKFGGTLNLLFSGGTYANNSSVRIFDFEVHNGDFATVNFSGLGDGQSATFNSSTGFVTVVPEPGAALLGGISMLVLLRRRRD